MGGFLQVFTVFLIVHDLDPTAAPVTTHPSSPWVKRPWTVNCMKWIMVTFLTVGLTNEAFQAAQIFKASLKVSAARLTVPRLLPLFMPAFQYCVLLGVVWGGVSVILSCQATPDILFNSLAITFIVG